jgi:hypothetical protein
MSGGWCYLNLKNADPGGEHYRLVHVIRSDGVDLPADNFWQTDRTFIEMGQRPVLEDSLHLVDFNSASGNRQYTLVYATRDQVGPSVDKVQSLGNDPLMAALGSLAVTFSEPIDSASFTPDDIMLTRSGALCGTAGVRIVGSGKEFRVEGLGGLTGRAGEYVLTVHAAGVLDLFGNSGVGEISAQWINAVDVPAVALAQALDAGSSGAVVDVLDVVFTEPINAGTFDADDLVLTRNGVPVSTTPAAPEGIVQSPDTLSSPLGGLTFTQTGPTSFRIEGLSALTAAPGEFRLGIRAAGVENLDGDPGIGTREIAWTVDMTPPVVSMTMAANAATNTPVDVAVVRFSEPVAEGFSQSSVTLERDGKTVTLGAASLAFVRLAADHYEITGLAAYTAQDGD